MSCPVRAVAPDTARHFPSLPFVTDDVLPPAEDLGARTGGWMPEPAGGGASSIGCEETGRLAISDATAQAGLGARSLFGAVRSPRSPKDSRFNEPLDLQVLLHSYTPDLRGTVE